MIERGIRETENSCNGKLTAQKFMLTNITLLFTDYSIKVSNKTSYYSLYLLVQ